VRLAPGRACRGHRIVLEAVGWPSLYRPEAPCIDNKLPVKEKNFMYKITVGIMIFIFMAAVCCAQVPSQKEQDKRAELAEYFLYDLWDLENKHIVFRLSEQYDTGSVSPGLKLAYDLSLFNMFSEEPWEREQFGIYVEGIGVPDFRVSVFGEMQQIGVLWMGSHFLYYDSPRDVPPVTAYYDGITTNHRFLGSYSFGASLSLLRCINVGYSFLEAGFLHSYIDTGNEVDYSENWRFISNINAAVNIGNIAGSIESVLGDGWWMSFFRNLSFSNTIKLKDDIFTGFTSVLAMKFYFLRYLSWTYNAIYDLWTFDIHFSFLRDYFYLQTRFCTKEPYFNMVEVVFNYPKLLTEVFVHILGEDEEWDYDEMTSTMDKTGNSYIMGGVGFRYTHFHPVTIIEHGDIPSHWNLFWCMSWYWENAMAFIFEFGMSNAYSQYNILNSPREESVFDEGVTDIYFRIAVKISPRLPGF
jgi:hypothetical protein